MNYLLEPDAISAQNLSGVLGTDVSVVSDAENLRWRLRDDTDAYVVVIGPTVDTDVALQSADALRLTRPDVSVVLVRRRVDTTVLTAALRHGVREVITEREPTELRDAVHRAAELAAAVRHQSVESAEPSKTAVGRVVTVFSAKGGVGKTTTSVNVATQLANGGARSVCLVDLDLAFGDVGVALRLKPKRTIAEAITMQGDVDTNGVLSLLTQHSPGLSVLLAPTEPATADLITGSLTADLLANLRKSFDYVVVDTPPAFTEHVLAAFDVSDLIVLVATMDVPTLKNLKLTIETLDTLRYPRERWQVLLNRADENVGLTVSDVESVLGAKVVAQIPISRDVAAAVNHGVVISTDQPKHPVSTAYRNFIKNVVTTGDTSSQSVTAITKHKPVRRRWFARNRVAA